MMPKDGDVGCLANRVLVRSQGRPQRRRLPLSPAIHAYGYPERINPSVNMLHRSQAGKRCICAGARLVSVSVSVSVNLRL